MDKTRPVLSSNWSDDFINRALNLKVVAQETGQSPCKLSAASRR